MADMSKIMAALGGFGAGYNGQGAQYLQGIQNQKILDQEQQQKEIQLDKERVAMMVQDAWTVNQLIDQGKAPVALKMLENRIGHINRLKGDPSDTQAIYDGLVSGDPERVAKTKQELQTFSEAGIAAKAWQPPQRPEDTWEGKKFAAEQGVRERDISLKERAQTWKEQHPNESNANNPYYQFIPTSEGLAVGDARTGNVRLAQGSGGGNLMPIAADVALKGQMAAAGAAGETQGKSTAQANIDLPKVESGAQKVKSLVNELIKHPGKESALGVSSYLPSIRGTERAAFDNRLAQLQGNTFLNAFESLKGGGQITEIEGAKAQAALNRMNNTVDAKEFDAAAKDFTSEIDRLTSIAKQRAKGGAVESKTQKTGGVLHVDAQGNKAMVYPDGSYEEVQ